MADVKIPERVEYIKDEVGAKRIIDKNFDDLFEVVNKINKRVGSIDRFFDIIEGNRLTDAIYNVSGHVTQLRTSANTNLSGWTEMNWDYEVRKDPDFYTHSTTVNPEQLTYKVAGDYRIKYGVNGNKKMKVRVKINGVVVPESISNT